MNAIFNKRVYMRSLATRGIPYGISGAIEDVLDVVKAAGYDLIIVKQAESGKAMRKLRKYPTFPCMS